MKPDNNLPPNLRPFTFLLGTQPPEVQEAFQFLLTTAMREVSKFEFVSVIDEQRSKR